MSQDVRRYGRGSEQDVGGAYATNIFLSHKPTGARTSLIVDPPDGRIPPLTPEATKRRQALAPVPARPASGDRGLQEQAARLRRWNVRAPVAETRGNAAVLCHRRRRRGRRHQSCLRPRGSDARRTVHGGHPPGFRRRRRLLPADRPVAAGRLDLLRHGPGPGMAAGDPDHGSAAPAFERPSVVGRLARPMGRRHARRRRDQLLARRPISRARARTCIWSSGGPAATRTRWNTW